MMQFMFRGILSLLLISTYYISQAQNIAYKDTIYRDGIYSVIFEKKGQPFEVPVIALNSSERIKLQFDDLGEEQMDYYYKIVHCDRNWNPSPLLNENDYLDGFNNELIENYEISYAVYTDYIHYDLELPNDFTNWTISGNYILHIYADDDEESPTLTRRFVVSEQIAPMSVRQKRPLDALKVRSHFEMDIDLNLEDVNAFDPLREISIDILQNNNWNTRRKGLIGQYMAGDIFKYNYTDSITFPSYKEFRYFDIRPLTFTTEFVSTIDLSDEGAEVFIFRDKSRQFTNYLTDIDANGNFIIDVREGGRPEVRGDYAWVTFTLEYPEIFDGDIYIYGEMTDWDPKEAFRMQYEGDGVYRNTTLLKQGYYNYMYLIKRDNGKIDYQALEGSWHETENHYSIIAYYSQDEDRYDRVIGFTSFNSNRRN